MIKGDFTLIVCSSCGVEKKRFLLEYAKRITKAGTEIKRPVHVDSKGKQWNGRQCPDCKYVKSKQQATTKTRKCLKCNQPMSVNYFYHKKCLEIVEQESGYEGDIQMMAKGSSGAWQAPRFSTG